MQNSTTIALSRLVAQSRTIEMTADNIANIGTPGFKASRAVFSDWLSRQTGTAAPRGGNTIVYTQDRASYRDQRVGTITKTDNPLDVAITGQGMFTVNTPNGPRLTRAGHFGLLPDGTIADAAGNALLDTNSQPLQISPQDSNITIASDGTVSSENGEIGQIGVVQPTDPNQLKAEGNRLYSTTSPTNPVSAPQLVQGAIEESNVQPVLELTRMLGDYREFQFTSQFVQQEYDRQNQAIGKILQPGA